MVFVAMIMESVVGMMKHAVVRIGVVIPEPTAIIQPRGNVNG